MDCIITYRNLDEAIDAIRSGHSDARSLPAMTELFGVPVLFDPHSDQVFIIRDDDESDEAVRVEIIAGSELTRVDDIIEPIGEDLEYCEDDDGADAGRVRRWVAELFEVYVESVAVEMRRNALHDENDDVVRDDRLAAFVDFRISEEIDRLRERMIVLESMRARNIRGRLEARGNRPGSKREVGKLFLLKQREVHDVLVADDRRFNAID